MKRNTRVLDPDHLIIWYYGLLYAGVFGWMIREKDPLVFLFYLISIMLLLVVWRIRESKWIVFTLILALSFLSLLVPEIRASMLMYLFYFFSGAYYVQGILTVLLFLFEPSVSIRVLALFVGSTAVLFSFWRKDHAHHWQREYQLRKRVYEQEEMENILLGEQKHLEMMSRLKERQRIAEVLHDELGHELTAAHLSLKAGLTLSTKENRKAEEALQKSLLRLEGGLTKLKEAVTQIEPVQESLLDTFHALFEDASCEVEFNLKGDISRLMPYQEQLLYSALKEGMTNILKHASPTYIRVELEVLAAVIRLKVENDGVKGEGGTSMGSGLRFMRKRLEVVHGTVSVRGEKGKFFLLLVLPLQGGENG